MFPIFTFYFSFLPSFKSTEYFSMILNTSWKVFYCVQNSSLSGFFFFLYFKGFYKMILIFLLICIFLFIHIIFLSLFLKLFPSALVLSNLIIRVFLQFSSRFLWLGFVSFLDLEFIVLFKFEKKNSHYFFKYFSEFLVHFEDFISRIYFRLFDAP